MIALQLTPQIQWRIRGQFYFWQRIGSITSFCCNGIPALLWHTRRSQNTHGVLLNLKRRASSSNSQMKQQTKKSIRKSFAFNYVICYACTTELWYIFSCSETQKHIFLSNASLDEDAMELNLCFVPKKQRARFCYMDTI